MRGVTNCNMIIDNLELVFSLIDKHCNRDLIFETDGHKLACSVLLRDEQEGGQMSKPGIKYERKG